MKNLQDRLKLQKPLSPHVTGILSLVIAAQSLMMRVGAVCERHGVTRPQYNVLRILRGAGNAGHPRHEIAARMVENAPDVTRILDRLVEAGYVRRSRTGTDRRESISRITPGGRRLLTVVDNSVSAEENAIGRLLAPAQWTQLAEMCEKLFRTSAEDSSDACAHMNGLEANVRATPKAAQRGRKL
jgi:DNA-binding MarR family transcriptional regulator